MSDPTPRRIQALPTEVVNRIAAGEVIQKPWNAVKELLENSVDAGSKSITITLRDGGYTGITIKDDGCGIHPEDAQKIATRFHSSKIKSVEDVYQIKTFGFRGEALSSMATAGKVVIISRREENQQGVRVFVEGSNRVVTPEDNLEKGTQIHVTGLFSSFTLSNVKRSTLQITALIRDYALILPNIKLILYTNEVAFRSPVFDDSPILDHKVWMESVLGCNLHEMDMTTSEDSEFRGKLFFADIQPNPKGGNKNPECITFVNQRLVEVPGLMARFNQALTDAGVYVKIIICVFELDPSFIDVHVSPTKHMVHMRDGGELVDNVVECFGLKIDEIHGSNEVGGVGPVTSFSQSDRLIVNDIRNHFSASDDHKSYISKIDSSQNRSVVPDSQNDDFYPKNIPTSCSADPWDRNSQELRGSTSYSNVPNPSQKIRIDHSQRTLHSFVQQSDKIGNSNSIISFHNETTKISQVVKKIPVLAPVVVPVPTAVCTMYRVISYVPVLSTVEEKIYSPKKVYYSYASSMNGKSRLFVFEVLNFNIDENLPEKKKQLQLRQLIVPESYLVYDDRPSESSEMSNDRPSLVGSSKFRNGMEYMQNVMDNLGTSKIDSTAILLKSYEKKQEAATYFNLKPAIVIEIGGRWTRYGMSGEYHPRGLLNSIVVNPDDGKKVHWLCNGLPKEQKQCLILSMMKTIVNRFMLHNGGEGRLVIVENILTPSADRQLLVDTVFEHRSLMVTDVLLVPAPITTTMAYGTNTALVVNIGYNETTVYPVCDQVILLGFSEQSDVGSKYFLGQIRDYFDICGKVKLEDGTLEDLNYEDLDEFDRTNFAEDIASGLCVVSNTSRGSLLRNWSYEKKEDHIKFMPNYELPLGKKILIVSGFIREAAAECFFTPEKYNDRPSLPELVYKCLKNCPIDYRKKLVSRIIVTGGPSELKGMFPRIRNELKKLLEERENGALNSLINEVRFLTIPGNGPDVPISRFDAWIGGAIYGSISNYSHKVLKNQDYAKNKKLSDWTDIVDNYKVPIPVDCKISEVEHVLAVNLKEVL